MKRVFLYAFFCALLCLCLPLLAGCGGAAADPPAAPEPVPPVVEPPPVPEKPKTPAIGAKALDDGRQTGGVAEGKLGDELTNVFFSFRVNKAELRDEFEGINADRGLAYLVAEIEVENVLGDPISMWSSDFRLQWGEGDRDFSYPIEKFSPVQMDDAFTLDADKGVTGTVVYIVQLPKGENAYDISYLEYFRDGVEGNTFHVLFRLSM